MLVEPLQSGTLVQYHGVSQSGAHITRHED